MNGRKDEQNRSRNKNKDLSTSAVPRTSYLQEGTTTTNWKEWDDGRAVTSRHSRDRHQESQIGRHVAARICSPHGSHEEATI